VIPTVNHAPIIKALCQPGALREEGDCPGTHTLPSAHSGSRIDQDLASKCSTSKVTHRRTSSGAPSGAASDSHQADSLNMQLHRAGNFLRYHSFPRFVIVGSVGFLVDAGVLVLLHYTYGMDVLPARLCSFNAAILTTWAMNRKMTFRAHASPRLLGEYGRYLLLGIAGGLLNLVIFLAFIQFSTGFTALPLPALAIASATALLFNYSGSRLFVFNHRSQPRNPT